MKKWIHAKTDGYLQTTKFTTPSIKTDDQRNALEAFEIAVIEKQKQFDAMCDRQLNFTSDSTWKGTIEVYEEGYYVKLYATRSNFNAFVQEDHVIRKPRNLSAMICYYDVEGTRGRVDWMSAAISY